MDALETLLQPVARLLNRNIAATTPARKLCAALDGTVAAVRVSDTALAMYFVIHEDYVALSARAAAEPDIVISGSMFALGRTLRGGGDQAIRDGSLQLHGDAERAQAFQQLLAFAQPDLEEELSSVIGGPVAHALGRIASRINQWAADASSTMGGNIREYLQEESRDLPTRYEVERFSTRVSTLRDDAERLAARLERLEDRS